MDEEGSDLIYRLKEKSMKKKRSKRKKTRSSKKPRSIGGSTTSKNTSLSPSSSDSPDSSTSSRTSASSKSGADALVSSKRIIAALIQNLNVSTTRQLEDKERDRKKLSMTSRMSPETAKMFTLLLAKNWADTKPESNTFIKLLLEDKGMACAVEIVQSEMKRWDGSVTGNGLIQFLSTGYINKNLDDRPGGFRFFRF
jgi:hypothetical protein